MTLTCGATKADGNPCASTVGICPDCGHCAAHCEHRADTMAKARSKGGRTAQLKRDGKRQGTKALAYRPASPGDAPPPPETAEDAKHYLAWLLNAGVNGDVGASLARDMSQVAERFLKALSTADLEARIAKLEKRGADK